MNTDKSYEWRRQLMWGVALVGLGVAIFLDRLELVDVIGLWHYWPLLMVPCGIIQMIGCPTAKHFTDGLWTVLMGLWLFAVFENLHGLTFRNSWPFVIISFGIMMILEPVIKKYFAAQEESGNEK